MTTAAPTPELFFQTMFSYQRTAALKTVWEKFARAMVPMMAMAAQSIVDILGGASSGPQRELDIAAGHGISGITVAQRNPQATVVAVDWPRVYGDRRDGVSCS